jgi:hypothetical protein
MGGTDEMRAALPYDHAIVDDVLAVGNLSDA